VNVLNRHLQATVFTLLERSKSQREIHRLTGVDRKTIRKYERVVRYERDRLHVERKRCFTKDEGGPLEVGLQEQASNRLKLRGLRVRVVSVEGKGGARLRQVRIKKTNASESLMTCRNVFKRRLNRDLDVCPAKKVGGSLPTVQPASGMKAA
jgi:hypothetical protein